VQVFIPLSPLLLLSYSSIILPPLLPLLQLSYLILILNLKFYLWLELMFLKILFSGRNTMTPCVSSLDASRSLRIPQRLLFKTLSCMGKGYIRRRRSIRLSPGMIFMLSWTSSNQFVQISSVVYMGGW